MIQRSPASYKSLVLYCPTAGAKGFDPTVSKGSMSVNE